VERMKKIASFPPLSSLTRSTMGWSMKERPTRFLSSQIGHLSSMGFQNSMP
jgi:hypothetical protein